MRILVVSDTHHNEYSLRRAVLAQPKAQVVIHLGDGEEEASSVRMEFPDKMFLQVRGNCDWGSTLPIFGEITLENVKIFYTHGYTYNVKYGLYDFKAAARDHGAQVALFGHTHKAMTEYENGIYFMNPGSLNGYGATYGIVDLTKAGIVTNLLHI